MKDTVCRAIIALSIVLTGVQFACAQSAAPAGDFAAFYPKARKATQQQPASGKLKIVCQRPGQFGSVALVSDASQKILIAAVSERPAKNAAALLDRDVNPHATQDWAYVWDRNGDGKIDYLALYVSVDMVVTDRTLPADFPRDRKAGLSKAQQDFMVDHMRATFNHAADDNFDGKPDVAVYLDRDAAMPRWVKGYAVLRSSRFDGRIDEDWAFTDRIAARLGPAPRNSKGYRVRMEPDQGVAADAVLPSWNHVFAEFNAAVTACGIGKQLRRN